MSYSFSFRAAGKAEAKAVVANNLAAVVKAQTIHEHDHAQVQAAADAFIDLMPDLPEGKVVSVAVNGWLSTTSSGVTGVSVGVSVGFADKA